MVNALEGTYYLFYKESKNPKRCYIGIKYPGINSTPFIIIGGRRAKEIYNFIIQLLDNNGIKYSILMNNKKRLLELPLATGLATSIFLLAVYSSLKPLKYATSLEKMILGKMPFTKYFVTITQLATELSNYSERKNMKYSRQTVDREAAKTTSKMLIQLMKGIEK
jgi:hypothetical protein